MRNLYLAFLCCLIVVLPGCSLLTPQQIDAGRASLDNSMAAGQITRAQHDAAVEALEKKGGPDWNGLLVAGVGLAGALTGTPIVTMIASAMAEKRVMAKRGPTEAERQAAKAANKPA